MNIVSLLNLLPLVINIFKLKGLNNVVILHCCKNNDIIKLQKIFFENNFKTTLLNLLHNESYYVPNSNNKIGMFLNGYCNGWPQVLNYLNNLNSQEIFQTEFVWFIIVGNINSATSILSQYPLDLNSDVIIATKNKSNFELYEIYNTGYYSNGVFKVNRVGYWDSTLHIEKKRRSNMSGVIIRSPIVLTERIINETYEHHFSNKKSVESMNKLKSYALLMLLRDMYNYSYKLQRVNSWGYDRNGSFDGVVGALHRNEGDFGGTCAFFRIDRAQLVDYIAEAWSSRQCFIFRHPKHPGSFYSNYTRPLTAKVWYSILGIIAASATALGFMLKSKAVSKQNNTDSSISLAVLFSWSANCQQGMTIQRDSPSVKILVFVIFVYSVTIYQYYNAVVVSSLLRDSPKNIRTLEDLLRSNLKAGAEDYVYARDYFKHTTDPVSLQIYHKKIQTDNHYNFLTAEDGMALVKKGGYAFHVDTVVAYRILKKTFTEREVCELQEVLMYPEQMMGMVIRKRSPYKEPLTYGIRKVFESGLMVRLSSVWDEPKPPCVRTPDSSSISVSLQDFAMALIVLATGMVVATIVMIGEVLVYRANERRLISFRP